MEYKQDDQEFINELLSHNGGFDGLNEVGQSPAGNQNAAPHSMLSYSTGESVDKSQPYSNLTPARQQELLQHFNTGHSSVSPGTKEDGYFIDEYLAQNQQPGREILSEHLLFQEPLNDDAMSNYTDELTSSLGSSVHTSDFLSPSSSFSYHPQQLNSVDSSSYTQYLSSSVRSPSTSLRGGNYLSSSLRGQHNMRYSSTSSTAAGTPQDSSSNAQLTHEEKLRRRREFHNAVERRRRELIKQKIKELSKLVPPSLLNYNDEGKEIKVNKGIILNRSVDYLEYLKQVLEAQDRKKQLLLKKVRELENYKRTLTMNNASVPQKHSRLNIENSNSPEQIIDTRIMPLMGENSATPSTFHDDLQQFLSGEAIEAEDNAKLIYGENGNGTSADYLLDFDK